MKLLKLACLLVFTLSMMNCSKSEDKVTLHYNQTQCADPWQSLGGGTDAEVIAAIKTYFETEYQIVIENLSISSSNNAIVCLACTCPSGKIISATVAQQYVDIMEDEGFSIP